LGAYTIPARAESYR